MCGGLGFLCGNLCLALPSNRHAALLTCSSMCARRKAELMTLRRKHSPGTVASQVPSLQPIS